MYRGNGFLAGRCVIPIRDENSRLVAYAGRAVHGEAPKYRFPSAFRKSHLLFNLDRARHTGARNVIVVEGFFEMESTLFWRNREVTLNSWTRQESSPVEVRLIFLWFALE